VPGTIDRYRVQEWLNYVTSELHKTFGLLFRPTTPEEFKTLSREFLGQRFDWIDKQLGRQSDGRQVHCRRCLSVHGAALVAARRRRSEQVAEHYRLFGSRRRTSKGAGAMKAEGSLQ
jgi:glutathione S-transferase